MDTMYVVITTRTPQFLSPPTGAITVRSVATLQEARDEARDDCFARDYDADEIGPLIHEAECLPEEGGRVGPLPDGTVIRVRRIVDRRPSEAAIAATLDELARLAEARDLDGERQDDESSQHFVARRALTVGYWVDAPSAMPDS